MYLVDTDWIIEYLKGNDNIVSILQKLFDAGLFVSTISVAELYEGVYTSNSNSGKLRHEENLMNFLSGVVVLGIDIEACKFFGKHRSELRRKGELIGDFDLLIASTALSNKLTVLTNNKNHFERIHQLNVLSEKDFE